MKVDALIPSISNRGNVSGGNALTNSDTIKLLSKNTAIATNISLTHIEYYTTRKQPRMIRTEMSKNPQKPTIILFASKDIVIDNNNQYLVITDKGGQKHKISAKRQTLWGVFNSARDAEPFMLIYETYNNVQYVADAKPITDDLLKLAVQDIGLKLADQQTEERTRSQAIAYAKDLFCADKVKTDKAMFDMAQEIYLFIKGVK